MPTVRIPSSSPSRRERTYAQLILRVFPRRQVGAFEGVMLRCGSRIDETALWPAPDYPETPLLVEYAGSDRSGRGHNRSNDVHVLWKYDAAGQDWIEIARVISQGPEWVMHLLPIVQQLLANPGVNFAEVAVEASGRVLALLDRELDVLEDEGRGRVMSFIFDQFASRAVEYQADAA